MWRKDGLDRQQRGEEGVMSDRGNAAKQPNQSTMAATSTSTKG